jgi:hypothetical protein
MELGGLEPPASWVRWKAGHLPVSSRNHRKGAWLLALRASAGTSISRRAGLVSSCLDADWTRPRGRRRHRARRLSGYLWVSTTSSAVVRAGVFDEAAPQLERFRTKEVSRFTHNRESYRLPFTAISVARPPSLTRSNYVV